MSSQNNLEETLNQVKDAAKVLYEELGGGYLEGIYEEAMAIELRERKIPYEVERNREIFYKGIKVGTHRLDFIVNGSLVVELKAGTGITNSHEGQTTAYLKATGMKKGLIINFPYPDKEEPDYKPVSLE